MRRLVLGMMVALATLTGCDSGQSAVDEALRQDLSLASQAFAPQQFMSPLEAGYAPNGYVQPGYGAAAPQQAVYRTAPRVVYRRAPATSSGSGTRVIKHTKRDAAIGAAAGAAIGAVTSARKDRLKGAVIGAAVGAVLGGVIGNNTDVKRVPQ